MKDAQAEASAHPEAVSVNVKRHARPCRHPRPHRTQDVDGRVKPGHDEREIKA
jgi:hypothetical protein